MIVRKTISILSILLVALSLFVRSPHAAAQNESADSSANREPVIGVVPGGANLRAAPNSNSSVVVSIPAGASVTILYQERGHSITLNAITSDIWYFVQYETGEDVVEGYIWSGLMLVGDDQKVPTFMESQTTKIVISPNITLIIQGHTDQEIALFERMYTTANEYLEGLGLDLTSLTVPVFIFQDRELQVRAVSEYFDVSTDRALQMVGAGEGAGGTRTAEGTFAWTGQYICRFGYGVPYGCPMPGEYLGFIFQKLGAWEIGDNNASTGWLTDGSQAYITNEIFKAAGFDLAVVRNWVSYDIFHIQCRYSLQQTCGYARHTMGPLAVAYLMNLTGDNPRLIFDFFSRMSQYPGQEGWHRAFQEIFGMSVTDFYDSFNAYLDVHAPFLTYDNGAGGNVLDSSGTPVLGVFVWVCSPIQTYDCVPYTTFENGEFGSIVDLRNGPVDVLVSLGTDPDPDHILGYFAGTGEPSVKQDDGTFITPGYFTTDRNEAENHLVHVDGTAHMTIQLPADIDITDILPVTCTWIDEINNQGVQITGEFCPPKN